MSRSFRKAIYTDGYGSTWKPFMKRQANKKVRRFRGEIPDGTWYRRLFNSWNICDFISDRAHRRRPPRDPSVRRRGDAWYVSK